MDTSLLEASDIPLYIWVEAVNCASYIQNRVPHKSIGGVTPFKALMGHKPKVSHLRVFCSKAWAIIPSNKRKSFQPQSSECILLGYAYDAKAYKLMEIATRICFIEQSVQFNEDTLHYIQPTKEEGINAQSIPFAYDDVSIDVFDSESEDEDPKEPDIDIEN